MEKIIVKFSEYPYDTLLLRTACYAVVSSYWRDTIEENDQFFNGKDYITYTFMANEDYTCEEAYRKFAMVYNALCDYEDTYLPTSYKALVEFKEIRQLETWTE